MAELKSYHKIQHFSDPAIEELLLGHVEIEEKIDGSQFRIHIEPNGEVTFGSRNNNFDERGVDKTFQKGIDSVKSKLSYLNLEQMPATYDIFGEYLQSPHHNTLSYERIPQGHIMVFDVMRDNREWATYDLKSLIAGALGLECVPTLWSGDGSLVTQELIDELLTRQSVLGKVTIEGIVIKNYGKFYNLDRYSEMRGKFLCGKIVRAEFTEANREAWASKKGRGIPDLITDLRTERRFEKAIEHLTEKGVLTNTVRDIPLIMKEVQEDILTEEGDRLKQIIWQKAWKEISGGVVKGIPEWYKDRLMKNVFGENQIETPM